MGAQLELFDAAPEPARETEPELHRRLDALLDGRLRRLVLTDNRSRILSVRSPGVDDPLGLVLRLHRCFLGVADADLAAVATIAGGSTGAALAAARRRLRQTFAARRPAPPPRRRRPAVLQPRGRCCDLEELRDELVEGCFEDPGEREQLREVGVTWGRAARRGPAKGASRRAGRGPRCAVLRLGSYQAETRTVRLHRVLDRPEVPRYVVAAVLYHELLHAVVPPRHHGRRRSYHGPEFRRRERRFPDHHRAEAWLERHLDLLLAAR